MIVLILGSGPNAPEAADWPKSWFDRIVTINNAHRIRPDWDDCIFPEDFPPDRHPSPQADQRLIEADAFVPAQNAYGGFVYGGGTMAFTAGYWALHVLKPRVIAFLGCDMVYAASGNTHFYGKGAPDPLRADISLRSLEAKSARLQVCAAETGCAVVNLSTASESRLTFPRARPDALGGLTPLGFDASAVALARATEERLGYMVASGRYWEEEDRFDTIEIDALDTLWRRALDPVLSFRSLERL